ncbi:MAG TPA: phosphatidate cytidylyltransferase [Chitinophagaceae bacterium]|jgi:membrane protein implicated in regulation of membrane protease activity|nr:phosphatidate cytidylyltransferase [Chitinophagaceae bacterium]
MKSFLTYSLLFLVMALTLTSCELAGDIFQAGFYAAIIIVVIVVVLIIWLFNRFRGRR